MDLSSLLLRGSNCFSSIYGGSGTGKTALGIEMAFRVRPSLFISTEGEIYRARVEEIVKGYESKGVEFIEPKTSEDLADAVALGVMRRFKLIVVDTINNLFRQDRKYRNFAFSLMTLREFSKVERHFVITLWQTSPDWRVPGQRLMDFYSDYKFKIEKNRLIGDNLSYCFKITSRSVILC